MKNSFIRDPAGGVNQIGVRDHNERLLLSLIHRHGAIASAEIARRTGLSPQTVSVILRKLETDELVVKGEPQRGKVGKPLTPMALRADGVMSFGLKIGRRSCDLVLTDFTGKPRARRSCTYVFPTPDAIISFLREGMEAIHADLTPREAGKICGIGIAAPFEMWNWLEAVNAPAEKMEAWRGFDFVAEIAKFSEYRVFIANDATAACAAEHGFGRGREIADYAYIFVGYFIGGGVVLNDNVFAGRSGNAAAFGTLPVADTSRPGHQLIHNASLYLLERRLAEAGLDPMRIWQGPDAWDGIEPHLGEWIDGAAKHIAIAIVAISSVIDFQAVILDGGFPETVRARLLAAISKALASVDSQGIALPSLLEGSVGSDARSIGAGSLPITAQYLLAGSAFSS
ncbi:ROK family protein [Albirhodobacter sp. R86504]|jgi:predicted NBD/HSP70 family sugar kinase|uniref:ROK family transcriptional regulator n=1 Tax=Albirhodobacter sp. R86504 TaxID=3093848 RepID=UPI00366AC8EB